MGRRLPARPRRRHPHQDARHRPHGPQAPRRAPGGEHPLRTADLGAHAAHALPPPRRPSPRRLHHRQHAPRPPSTSPPTAASQASTSSTSTTTPRPPNRGRQAPTAPPAAHASVTSGARAVASRKGGGDAFAHGDARPFFALVGCPVWHLAKNLSRCPLLTPRADVEQSDEVRDTRRGHRPRARVKVASSGGRARSPAASATASFRPQPQRRAAPRRRARASRRGAGWVSGMRSGHDTMLAADSPPSGMPHSPTRGEPVPARPRVYRAARGLARMAGEHCVGCSFGPAWSAIAPWPRGGRHGNRNTRTRGPEGRAPHPGCTGGGSSLLVGIAPLLLGLAGLIVLEGPADRPELDQPPAVILSYFGGAGHGRPRQLPAHARGGGVRLVRRLAAGRPSPEGGR